MMIVLSPSIIRLYNPGNSVMVKPKRPAYGCEVCRPYNPLTLWMGVNLVFIGCHQVKIVPCCGPLPIPVLRLPWLTNGPNMEKDKLIRSLVELVCDEFRNQYPDLYKHVSRTVDVANELEALMEIDNEKD